MPSVMAAELHSTCLDSRLALGARSARSINPSRANVLVTGRQCVSGKVTDQHSCLLLGARLTERQTKVVESSQSTLDEKRTLTRAHRPARFSLDTKASSPVGGLLCNRGLLHRGDPPLQLLRAAEAQEPFQAHLAGGRALPDHSSLLSCEPASSSAVRR